MLPDAMAHIVRHGSATVWQQALVRLGVVWAALILAFAGDWLAMVRQWWDSSTYNHILLVPLILAWLVSMRVAEMRRLVPQVWGPGLLLVGGSMLLWIMGRFAGFNLVQQAGAVAFLPASLIMLLGPRVATALAFPMFYMIFLVPFGDELVPQLQMITAVLTIALVQVSGIPSVIDGVFIDTPAGLFEVAEACSGVKFLVAMIALGALVANVCFQDWRRRALFMALCIIAPILANAVRAWGTIYVAQYIGAERAGGFDHIVYGWLFFALVIAGVLGLSWRHFDRGVDDPMISADRIAAMPLPRWLDREARSVPLVILACGVLTMGGQVWARSAEAMQASLPRQIYLPAVPGWEQRDLQQEIPWVPRAAGADHRLIGRYADGKGRNVEVFLALYAAQGEGREASGFGEGALPQDSEWSWNSAGPSAPGAKSDILRARGKIERFVETYYRNGDLLTGSPLQLKLAIIADRAALRREPTVMLILSAETTEGQDGAQAIAAFRQSIGPVGPWIDRIAAVR